MGTFDENLNAYHALSALDAIYVKLMTERLMGASTPEEVEALMQEGDAHWAEQEKRYKELGEEMVEIMSKKWWQFWK